jgi:hypothetical protein
MNEDRFDLDTASYFLSRLFGTREGFVAMAFGHNPRTTKPRFRKGDFRERYYAWPQDKDDMLGEIDELVNNPLTRAENVEVFINPALRSTPSRKAGTNAPLWWVWADVDHPPTDGQIDRINALGAMTVLSGSDGHRHVYVELAKPVNAENHQAMCRALKEALGADSKIAENDLLRLPGTLNWKTTVPKNVTLKSIGSRRPARAKAIVDRLTDMTATAWSVFKKEATEAISDGSAGSVSSSHPAPKIKSLPKSVRKAFNNHATPGSTTYSRSDAIYELVSTCKEQGVTREDTHALVRTFPAAMDKWGSDWRISNDVERIWLKADGPKTSPSTDAEPTFDEADDGSDQAELNFVGYRQMRQRVANAPAPRYLFDGIIAEGDYGMLAAEDKAGKSLVMLDAGISAASGTKWMNRFECNFQGDVILCLGEGSERKQVRRIDAIARSKGLTEKQIDRLPLHILLSVPQVKDEDHIIELEEKIRTTKAVLCIIDPFYLAASGVDFAKLSDVGQALKPVQEVCQRYNCALIISHHWNKTGTGTGSNRTSGVGLTAWGRFLISVEIKKSSSDPVTRKTVVLQNWEIKGDEVMTEDFAVERTVWVDDPTDLSSPMHYELTLPDGQDVKRSTPLKNPATMEKISEVLSENMNGLGINAIKRGVVEQSGKSISTQTAQKCLDQLILHGYAQEGRPDPGKRTKPYLHIKSFTRAIHEQAQTNVTTTPATKRSRSTGRAQPRTFDMSGVTDGPRRRKARVTS